MERISMSERDLKRIKALNDVRARRFHIFCGTATSSIATTTAQAKAISRKVQVMVSSVLHLNGIDGEGTASWFIRSFLFAECSDSGTLHTGRGFPDKGTINNGAARKGNVHPIDRLSVARSACLCSIIYPYQYSY